MPNLTLATAAYRKRFEPLIAAGYLFTFVVKSDRSGWSWGSASNGTLGDNTITNRSSPVAIYGNKKFYKIAAGYDGGHGLAIDQNGKAWAWGYNLVGQLGDRSVVSKRTPIAVCGNRTFCQIAAAMNFASIAIDYKGKAWGWGSNTAGQLGDNSITNRCTPVAVCGTQTFCKISMGNTHTVAIDKNGKGWAWGFASNGRLGDNSIVSKRTPVAICGNKTFCHISAGQTFVLAIDKNGKGWSWGQNTFGVLGDNTTTDRSTPIGITGTRTFCRISAGYEHSLALDYKGKAWAWGIGIYGLIGTNAIFCSCIVPAAVCHTNTFCEISAGRTHNVAIDKDNKIWVWGYNFRGLTGNKDNFPAITPIALCTTKTFCQIQVGTSYSMAIDNNQKVWGWGFNNSGQIGDNTNTIRYTPVAICGNKTFCQISQGEHHTVAIDYNGKAWAWGLNNFGGLGDNSILNRSTPVAVCGNKTFCKVSAGYYFTLGIDKNGKLWSWGYQTLGNLGINAGSTCRSTPVAVCGNRTFCQISGGVNFSLGIDYKGKGWGWGWGFAYPGDGTTTQRNTPVAICGNKTFCKIAAGFYTSLAIDKNGKGWAWGNNTNGNVGDNSGTARNTPVAICGNKTFCEIANTRTGRWQRTSFGIDKNGRAFAWGYQVWGQYGNNDASNQRLTPIAVCGGKTFCKISGGQTAVIAIDKNGKSWAWGYNAQGEMGTSTFLPTSPNMASYL